MGSGCLICSAESPPHPIREFILASYQPVDRMCELETWEGERTTNKRQVRVLEEHISPSPTELPQYSAVITYFSSWWKLSFS